MSWNDLRKGRYSQENCEYFITFNTRNRVEYFHDFLLGQLFCQQIKRNEKQCQCVWLTWVLMPDHFHGLLRLNSSEFSLSEIVGKLKGSSSYILNQRMNRRGPIWQASFYDRALRKNDDRKSMARYIIANPLRKNLVQSIKKYPFWDSVYLSE